MNWINPALHFTRKIHSRLYWLIYSVLYAQKKYKLMELFENVYEIKQQNL